jgi:NitT/TauT family transport system substrate-binding protein
MVSVLGRVGLLLSLVALATPVAAQVTHLRVGWCSRTVSSAATPFAVAAKLGWFKQDGIDVELVPIPGRRTA